MKKAILILSVIATFSSCTKCYECRVLTSTTINGGFQQNEPPVIMEKCGMTARQARKFQEEGTITSTYTVNGDKYVTSQRTYCK